MEFTHDELFEQFLDKVNVDRNTESYRKLLKYRKEKLRMFDIINCCLYFSSTEEGYDYWRSRCQLWYIYQLFNYNKCPELIKDISIDEIEYKYRDWRNYGKVGSKYEMYDKLFYKIYNRIKHILNMLY